MRRMGTRNVPSVENDAYRTASVPENGRTCRKRRKPPNLTAEAVIRRPNKSNGFANHANVLGVYTDGPSVADETDIARNTPEAIRTRQTKRVTERSPIELEIESSEPACRCWRW